MANRVRTRGGPETDWRQLERRVRARGAPARDVERARILRLAAEASALSHATIGQSWHGCGVQPVRVADVEQGKIITCPVRDSSSTLTRPGVEEL